MTKPEGTLLLTGRDVAALLTIEECMDAVENAFRLYAEGCTQPPGLLGVHVTNGGFHIKAGTLNLARHYFAAKVNANFPNNTKQFDLPTIQGVVILCDAENGYPLSVMDSIEITIQRTGAATGIAAKYLARNDSKTATICGCGNQGRISLRALSKVLKLRTTWVYDMDHSRANKFAKEMSDELSIEVIPVYDLKPSALQSAVWVTCTTSTQAFLRAEYVAPGAFVAAVGADNPEKQELEPTLLSANKVVVDILEQAATIGELHHALDVGIMEGKDVYAELGEVIAGLKPGRVSDEEITVFDSTGMALQDVVTAALVYEKALNQGAGTQIKFN
jgi:alanine dehydrogenase